MSGSHPSRELRWHLGLLVSRAILAGVLTSVACQCTVLAQDSNSDGTAAKPVLEWKFANSRGFGDDREELIQFHRVLETLQTKPADEMPWENLLHDLAHLLDRQRDLHVELAETIDGAPQPAFLAPGERRRVRAVSLWTTIDQLIGELPPAGRREWVKLRGATGAQQLEQAIADGELNGLRAVARRFVHTPAGYEALERVGTHHLDRDTMVLAVRQFEKLRRSPEGRRSREPMLSLKAAAAWASLGRLDRASKLLEELDEWLDQNPGIDRERFALLTRPIPVRLKLLQAYAAQSADVGSSNLVWTHFLGTPQRTAQAAFSPIGDMLWESTTTGFDTESTEADRERFTPKAILDAGENDKEVFPTTESEMVAFVESGMKWLDDYDIRAEHWHIPAGYPVIADGVAMFRTFNRVRAVELKSGDIRWEVFMTDYAWEEQFNLDNAEAAASRQPKMQEHLFSPFNQKQSEFVRIRTRNDRTTGSMSTDGKYLFFIEDCGIPSSRLGTSINNRLNRSGPMPHNRLVCADVESGILQWDLGGPSAPKSLPAADYFFLGPPTIVDGRAYVLGELSSRIRLFCLDPPTGEILWEQDIADTHLSTNFHGLRRVVGASPTEASGLLICPLTDGTVVAVDPDLRSTAWTWRYESAIPTAQVPNVRPGMFRGPRMSPHVPDDERWRDLAVMDAEGVIVVTPPDANALFCLDIVTGEPVWSAPRQDGLYLATVYQDQVVVVESDSVRALSLVDGSQQWRVDFDQRRPSGRGLRTDHVLHVPLKTIPVPTGGPVADGASAPPDIFNSVESRGLIASFDLRHGSLLVETETPDARPAGNLIAANGILVSQEYSRVVALPALQNVEEQLNVRSKQPDENSAALATLARLRLHQGNIDDAVEHLKQVVTKSPQSIPSELVLRAVMHEIRSTGRAQSDLLDLFAAVPLQPMDHLALTRVRVELLLKNKQLPEAFNLLAETPVTQDGSPLIIPAADVTQAGPEWRAAQLADLLSRMTPEQREGIRATEPDLTQAAAMRDWLSKYGSINEAAPSVRMKLAVALDPSTDLLEIESLLSAAMADKGDASAEVARNFLWLESGHGAAARLASKDFVRRWSKQSLPGDLTAKDIVSEWLQHETMQKLPQPVQWPASATVRIEDTEVSEPPDEPDLRSIRFTLPFLGSPSVAVDGWLFEITPAGVTARDALGRELWTVGPDEFPNVEFPQLASRRPAACIASDGHLLAIMLGTGFSVFDISEKQPKRLWTRALLDATSTGLLSVRWQNQGIDPARRIPVMFLPQSRLVGLVDCLAGGCLVYRTLNTLHCVDAVTGRLKWRRTGVRVSARTASDGRYLTLADYDGLQIQLLQVLDLQTGHVVRNAIADITGDTAPLKNFQILDWTGRSLIGRRRGTVSSAIECFDPLNGKQLWQHSLTPQITGLWYPVGRAMLVGLDAKGQLKVCDKRSGRLLLETQVPATPQLQLMSVHETETGFVLFAAARFDRLFVSMNSLPALNTAFVGGLAHGIDIDNGKVLWTTELPQQFAPLPQPRDLPFVQFRSRRSQSNSARGATRSVDYPIGILDVRSGQVVKTIAETTRPPESVATVDVENHEVRFDLHGNRQAIIDFRQDDPAEQDN